LINIDKIKDVSGVITGVGRLEKASEREKLKTGLLGQFQAVPPTALQYATT
jgi:hypothetical protein